VRRDFAKYARLSLLLLDSTLEASAALECDCRSFLFRSALSSLVSSLFFSRDILAFLGVSVKRTNGQPRTIGKRNLKRHVFVLFGPTCRLIPATHMLHSPQCFGPPACTCINEAGLPNYMQEVHASRIEREGCTEWNRYRKCVSPSMRVSASRPIGPEIISRSKPAVAESSVSFVSGNRARGVARWPNMCAR